MNRSPKSRLVVGIGAVVLLATATLHLHAGDRRGSRRSEMSSTIPAAQPLPAIDAKQARKYETATFALG